MSNVWVGVFWKVVSCGCFAGVNTLVRYLSGGSPYALASPLPIYNIMFFQNLIGFLCMLPWIIRQIPSASEFKTARPGLHIARILTATAGIGMWYLSLKYIPVTQVVAISFVAPMITLTGAVVFLRETLTWQRAIAISLSILGGFFITRPDQSIVGAANYGLYALLPILAAFIFAFDKLVTRKLLSLNESPKLLTWYLLLSMIPLSLIPNCFYGWITPPIEQAPWLILLGILGALAHYAFNKAYALAEITFLMPFGVAKILLCGLVSYCAFAELPKSADMWLGITVIIGSLCVLNIHSKPKNPVQEAALN